MRLDDQEAGVRTIGTNLKTVGCATGDHNVVTLVIGKQAEVGLQYSLSIMDKVDLITFSVAIKVVHGHCGLGYSQGYVLVEHEYLASQHGISSASQFCRF